MNDADFDSLLLRLIRSAQGLPGVVAVAAYELRDAQTVAHLTGSVVTEHGPGVTDPMFQAGVSLPDHPLLQQLLRQRAPREMPASLFLSDAGAGVGTTSAQLIRSRVYAYPVVQQGETIGFLACFIDGHASWQALSAAFAALADAASVLGVASQRVAAFGLIQRVAGAVVSQLDLDQVLAEITAILQSVFNADRAVVWLYHEEEGILERKGVAGTNRRRAVVGERIPVGESIHGLSIKSGQVLYVEDIASDQRLDPQRRALMVANGTVTSYSFPIVFEGRSLGSLGVSFAERLPYDRELVELGQSLSNFIAIALRNAREYEQVARRARELGALHRIGRAVVARQEMPTILLEIAEATREGLRADRVTLWLYYADDDTIELGAASGLDIAYDASAPRNRVPITSDTTRQVVHERKIVVMNEGSDVSAEGSELRRAQVAQLGLRTRLVLPVLNADRVLGVLSVSYVSHREFDAEIRQVAETIANHAAAAIENADLYQRVAQRAQEMALLNSISSRLTANLDLPTVLQSIADSAVELFQANNVSIWGKRDENTLEPLARSGGAVGFGFPPVVLTENRPQAVAMKTKRTVFIQDVATSTRIHPDYLPTLVRSGVKSSVYIPMIHNDDGIGVIILGFHRTIDLPEHTQALMEEMASHAGAAITNARMYEQTASLAARDGLTGIFNYREFYLRLREEVARSQRTETPLSVILMDLDDFKQVNDEHGHQQGDSVLRETADLLQREVRLSDVVARYGGEEFALILPGASRDVARRIAERTRRAIMRHQFTSSGPSPRVTLSAGIATFPFDGVSSDELVSAADRALYSAKRSGKNRVVHASDAELPSETRAT